VLDTFGEKLDELPLTFDSSEYTRNLSKAAAAYSQ
jgi:hypothetical protein